MWCSKKDDCRLSLHRATFCRGCASVAKPSHCWLLSWLCFCCQAFAGLPSSVAVFLLPSLHIADFCRGCVSVAKPSQGCLPRWLCFCCQAFTGLTSVVAMFLLPSLHIADFCRGCVSVAKPSQGWLLSWLCFCCQTFTGLPSPLAVFLFPSFLRNLSTNYDVAVAVRGCNSLDVLGVIFFMYFLPISECTLLPLSVLHARRRSV